MLKTHYCAHTTYHQRYLQQTAQLILVLYTRLGVYKPTLIRNGAIGADKNVIRDSLAKNLDLQDVGDNLLRLAVDIRVDERNIVIACDHVAECG